MGWKAYAIKPSEDRRSGSRFRSFSRAENVFDTGDDFEARSISSGPSSEFADKKSSKGS
jgi:hypothetical protein